MKINAYWKTVVASLGPVLLAIQSAADDGQFTLSEGIGVGIAALVALGVYAVPNRPQPPEVFK